MQHVLVVISETGTERVHQRLLGKMNLALSLFEQLKRLWEMIVESIEVRFYKTLLFIVALAQVLQSVFRIQSYASILAFRFNLFICMPAEEPNQISLNKQRRTNWMDKRQIKMTNSFESSKNIQLRPSSANGKTPHATF